LHHDAFREKMADLARKYKIDIAIFEGLGVAQYRDVLNGIPAVLYEHNVEYELTEQFVASLRGAPLKVFKGGLDQIITNCWLYLFGIVEARRTKRLELSSLRKFDCVLNCSDRDAAILRMTGTDFNGKVLPWCIEIPSCEWSDRHDYSNKKTYNLLFLGSMTWEPNKDAIFWFVREILPLIHKDMQNVNLQIVGSFRDKEIMGLHDGERIIVRGYVEDLSEVMNKADIFIAPIRMGSGVNVKVLDAMSHALPVVTTSKGAEGLDVQNGKHLVIGDAAHDFAEGVLALLYSANLRKKIGVNGYEYVVRNHSAERIVDRFDSILRELCSTRGIGKGSVV